MAKRQPKLKKFRAEGLEDGLDLFAVSPADAAAEAFANRDNQVYYGKGAIALREGMQPTAGQPTVGAAVQHHASAVESSSRTRHHVPLVDVPMLS